MYVLRNSSASKTTQCLNKNHLNNISFGRCIPPTDKNKTSVSLQYTNSKNTITQNKSSIWPYKKIHNVIYRSSKRVKTKTTEKIYLFLDLFCI
jgi:hypothetical protein